MLYADHQDQKKISMTIWYFNVHGEMCPDGEIRGQDSFALNVYKGLLNRREVVNETCEENTEIIF
jgi:hypothetical protein